MGLLWVSICTFIFTYVKKHSKKMGGMLKKHRNPPKGAPSGQIWNTVQQDKQ